MVETLARQKHLAAKFFATLFAIVLAVSFAPPTLAFADEITGGAEIDSSGTYQLAAEATGTISIVNENLEVTIEGKGSAEKFSGLNIQAKNGTKLTIKDLYADQGADASTIDFEGDGTLIIEGQNLIDNDGGLNAAVIHVAPGNEVHFTGTGTLYGYKSALCSYIGGNNGEANGKIIFDGGYWFLKGSKTGAVIGGDSSTDKGGDIIINGGELYVKGVARGALIGGSNQGKSGDVYVNGGLVELFEDFSGPAIGAGQAANAGNLTVTGGSLKTTLSSNSANAYGEAATFGGMPGISWKAVKALNANDYALLAFDASAYINDLANDTVTVNVDGSQFYSGRAYTYVTNEVKNPPQDVTETPEEYAEVPDTICNWLTNDAKWLVTQEDYGTSAYPSKFGSSLVPEKNLYFALSKENHTLTVGGDTYDVTYDAATDSFTCVNRYKAIAAPLVDGTEGSTFTVPDDYGIAQVASDNAAGYKDVAVTFAGTGIAKHKGTTGEMPEGYWVGIGIPATLGSTYAVDFGEYSADATWDGAADSSVTKDGIDYNTFYFSVPTTATRANGYVAVKDGDEVTAVYTLDFSNVKLLNTVTPTAPDNGSITLATAAATGEANAAISAIEGENVTVTVASAEGYEAKKVTYTYGDTTSEATATETAGVFEFTMPAQPTTVAATISLIPVTKVETAADLAAFAAQVNGGMDYADTTVTLAADIDLSEYADWTPIGGSGKPFAGTFDGAGHAITGLSITTGGGYKGLFGNNTGTVKNFTISGNIGAEGAYVGGRDFYGVVAFNTGDVLNIVSTLSIYPGTGDTYAIGGVVGKNENGMVAQCGFDGVIASDTSKSIYRTGGVVGFQSAGLITECYNTADVTAWNYRNGNQGIGGILGSMEGGTVSFCYNTGTTYNGWGDSNTGGKQGSGGIVGAISTGDVSNCYSVGDAHGPGSAGVIIGKVGNGAYDHLFSLDTSRAYQQYGTKIDSEHTWGGTYTNVKYADGTDENADGSIKFGGAAIANSYNSGYTISNSWTKSADAMQSSVMVIWLNTKKDGTSASAFAYNEGGFPILAWQGGTVVKSYELTADNVSGIEAEFAKTDAGVSPEVAVAVDGVALTQDADYTLSYATKGGAAVTAPFTIAGSYVATIAGTGSADGGFYGTVVIEFTILPSVDDLTIAEIPDQAYTGKAIKPAIEISYTDADGNTATLIQGTDFSVKYKDNKVVGEATATIVGSDNYDLNATVTFNIVPANLASGFTIADIDDQLFEGTDVEPSIKLTNDATGDELVEDEDYFLTYFKNDKAGTASVKATGKGNYTGSTKQKEFTIYTADLAQATVKAETANFTGEVIEPKVTVTYNGKEIPAAAYTVSCESELKNVGTYTLKVTGNDVSTSGENTCEFVIDPKAQAISASDVSVVFGKTATVGAKLTEGDGKLSYKSSSTAVVKVDASGKLTPVKVGSATITVTAAATDNYAKATKDVKVTVKAGKQALTFKAQKKTVKAAKVKKAKQTVAIKKATGAKTTVTYSISKVNKSKKNFSINKKTGKITVKKGTAKGTYKVTVKASAKKTANWAAASKSAVITIQVK